MNYRNYEIDFDTSTGRYVARSCDDDFRLVSSSQSRLKRAIDQLWTSLKFIDGDALKLLDIESLPLPGWIRTWLRSDSSRVDLDRAFSTGNC